MPFPYYRRLSRRGKEIYRRSDAITEVMLGPPDDLRIRASSLERALVAGDRIAVELACQALAAGLCAALRVGPVSIRVEAKRPRSHRGELHGLYVREERKRPVISVWMRTAAHRQVVAFRTFLRTLLHEVCHHLDYELLRLPDSLHTEGFFRRESSIMRQLVPAVAEEKDRAGREGNHEDASGPPEPAPTRDEAAPVPAAQPAAPEPRRRRPTRPRQLDLPWK
ncbi:MAG: hypothetical protein HYY06_30095 [Deltaproteobacteria bacterium]|nr:hypothetical protein [Deltaproteobacteria bacterium]